MNKLRGPPLMRPLPIWTYNTGDKIVMSYNGHDNSKYTCTHIEGGTNGASDANQLDMASLELSVRVICAARLGEGGAHGVVVAIGGDVLGVANTLLLVGGVGGGRVVDVASHLEKRFRGVRMIRCMRQVCDGYATQ